MQSAGIDIGSRTIEYVVREAGRTVFATRTDTTFDPLTKVRAILAAHPCERLMATGYGRTLLELAAEVQTVTEIKAYGRSVRELYPEVSTILDIGGQDSKCIVLGPDGRVVRFEMNDRCAAGTGKFLEVMAAALQYPLDEFGDAALGAGKVLAVSAMCTVFAESEVTSLVTRGEPRDAIALGLHKAVVQRAAGMIRRLWPGGTIVFAGGVARNRCIHRLLEEELRQPVLIPDDPQMIGALGAALLMEEHV